MAELLLILAAPAGLYAGLGAIDALAAAARDPWRRCLACGRVVWPWQRRGWRVTEAGTLRWHGDPCRG